jgi:hypothetical protein
VSDKVIRIEAGELRHVEVRPGDLFVLRTEHRLSLDELDAIREQWAKAVGTHVPLVVIEDADLTVFRSVEADRRDHGHSRPV